MDYDMYWVDVPDEWLAQTDAAVEHLFEVSDEFAARLRSLGPEAGRLGDAERELWARREAAFDALREAQPYYFRLNMWGMALGRSIMCHTGMAVDSEPPGRSPLAGQYGPPVRQWLEEHGRRPAYQRRREATPDIPELTAYLDQRDAYARAHSAEEPGIPVHKLSSHEGWQVTPDEIEPALQRAPDLAFQHDPFAAGDEPVGWWVPWLRYLRNATAHGGFEVW